MKKLILTITALSLATGAFAQGFVSLANTSSLLFTTNSATWSQSGSSAVNPAAAGSPASTTNYYFAVLTQTFTGSVSTDSSVWDGTWAYTGLLAVNNQAGTAGRIVGLSGVQANNWAVGQTNNVIIVGWSASLGNSWLTVSNLAATSFAGNSTAGFFGVSSIGFVASASSFGPFPSIWSTAGPQTYGNPISTGFSMYTVPVPEPGTIALATLGGLSMLVLRRRKA